MGPEDLRKKFLLTPANDFKKLVTAHLSKDEQDYPSAEKLQRMREHDEFTLVSEKRQTIKWLMRITLWGGIVALVGFFYFTGFYMYNLCFGPKDWVKDHLSLQEIVKTGWTITMTLIATKVSDFVFKETS